MSAADQLDAAGDELATDWRPVSEDGRLELEDENPAGRPPAELECPECFEDFTGQPMAKARLGLHRKREHGVQGKGGHHRIRRGEARAPRPRAERPPAAARAGRVVSRRDLEEGTREAYESIGLMMLLRGDEDAARLIVGEKRFAELMDQEPTREGIAGQAAKAWAKLAQHNETIEKTLGKTLTGGDWAELISAHMPLLILAIQRNPQKAASVAGGLAGALRKRFKAARARHPSQPGPHGAPAPNRGYGTPPGMSGPRVAPGA